MPVCQVNKIHLEFPSPISFKSQLPSSLQHPTQEPKELQSNYYRFQGVLLAAHVAKMFSRHSYNVYT